MFSGLIDPSVEAIVASCKQSSLQKQSYGVTLVGAGVGNTMTSYLEGNRKPTDLYKDVYNLDLAFTTSPQVTCPPAHQKTSSP